MPERWPEQLAFQSHGARIVVRASTAGWCDELRKQLPPASVPGDVAEADATYTVIVNEGAPGNPPGAPFVASLYLDGRLVQRGDRAAILAALASDFDFRVGCAARSHVFVHAGVVAVGGRAVLLPGRTHAGKSSLVAALVESGARYYSDEYALFDGEGRVHPYPRPLRLRPRPAGEALPDIAGADNPGRDPVPVGLVIAARYRPGGRWQPRELTAGEAALLVFDNSMQAQTRPHDALRAFERGLKGALAFEGERGEAAEVAAWILDRAGRIRAGDP